MMYRYFVIAFVCVFMSLQVGATDTLYTVKPGDSLSKIAKKFYSNSSKWLPILNANRDIVRDKGSLLYVGTELRIPDLNSPIAQNSSVYVVEANSDGKPVKELVTAGDYAPFTDESLPEGGLFTEIVKVVFDRAGYKPVIEFLNWDYAIRATKESKFTASFPWFYNKERAKTLWYSKPVYEVLILVYSRQDSPFSYNTLDDLKGLSVCRPDGYFLDDIKALIEKKLINHVAPKTPQKCFEMLRDGDVDLVSVNELGGNSVIQKMGLESLIIPSTKAVSIRTLHIIYPKFNPTSRGVVYKVDQALDSLMADGTINHIIERHLRLYYATKD